MSKAEIAISFRLLRSTMAQLLSGKDVATEIRHRLQVEVASYGQQFKPGLTIVQVGGRTDSNVYINMKLKAAQEIGINAQHLQLSRYFAGPIFSILHLLKCKQINIATGQRLNLKFFKRFSSSTMIPMFTESSFKCRWIVMIPMWTQT